MRVQEVIDGDTIELENGQRVRLIGIDTPERGKPGADAATQFVKGKVEGKEVWLESDGADKDNFGRFRRYVWLQRFSPKPDENQICRYMLNALLISSGHAKATGEHKYTALFERL